VVRRLALLLAFSALAVPARAEDDWQVTRPRNPPQVVARYRAMLERNPDDKDALRRVLAAHKLETLLRDYRERVEKSPNDANLRHLLGLLERRAGNAGGAVPQLEAAARLAPDRLSVNVALGELYRQLGRNGEARAALERALGLTKGAARKPTLRALLDLALADKDVARARQLQRDLQALEPNSLALRGEWAEALVRLEQLREAVEVLTDLERRHGGDVVKRLEVMKRRGELLEKLGDDAGAAQLYRDAFGQAPRSHWLRRDLFDRVAAVARKRDALRPLLAECERSFKDRGFFEWSALARLYDEVGEPQKALDAYRKANEKDRFAVETRERLIRLLDRLGESAPALVEYERLIAIAPGEPRYQLELAERLFRRGDRDKALALLRRCAARFAGDASVHASLGDLYARWGEAELALKESELLVRAEPNDEAHIINLGDQYFQRNKKPRAVEVWKRLLGIGKREKGMARLAEVYADHDMLLEAIDLYQKALKIAPNDPMLHRGLAQIYERQKRTDPAVAAWEKVMQHATGGAAKGLKREARTRIVSLLGKSYRLPRRIEEYRLRLTRNPADLESAWFLVDAYLALGRTDDAIGMLDHILTRDPRDEDALAARARAHRARRHFAQAIADLERLAALQPLRARDCLEQMADIAHAMGRDAEALGYARRALALAPADASAHAHLAGLFEKQDDPARAIAEYRKAIELAPHGFTPYFAAARLLARTGSPREAAQLYREVLRLASDEDVLLQAGRRAMDLEEYLGTLGELERELWPLAFAQGRKPAYRKLLVELFDRYAPPLVGRAARGDAAARAELRRLGEHGLAPLLEALGDDGSPQQRLALMLLGHFANRSAAPALMRLTREPPPPPKPPSPPPGRPTYPRTRRFTITGPGLTPQIELRVLALYAAGRLGDPRVEADILHLAEDKDVSLRAAATWSLTGYPSTAAQTVLKQALSDTKREVQAVACLALGLQRARAAAPTMVRVMNDGMLHPHVRAACAEALGLVGERDTVPPLIQALETTPAPVQARAAGALGRLGDARATVPLVRAYFVGDAETRRNALWALARLRAPAAAAAPPAAPPALPEVPLDLSSKPDLDALLARLDPSERPAGAARALLAARRELPAIVYEALVRRPVAARTLDDLDEGPHTVGLGPILGDVATLDPRERAEVEAVVAEAAASARRAVRPLLGHQDRLLRERAVRVGARLGLDETAPLIARDLGGDDAARRAAAIVAAGRLVSGRCGPAADLAAACARHLDASQWPKRLAAAEALGRIGAACDVQAARAGLARAARDGNGFVREAAVTALGRLAGPGGAGPAPEVLGALTAAVEDEAEELRIAAAQALGALRGRGHEPRVEALLGRLAAADQPERVRAAARIALGQGSSPRR
jgi:cellulose synthase operon protein C